MNNAAIEELSNDPALIAAAEWFERLQDSSLAIGEVTAWQEWMTANPSNKAAFERIQDLWSRLDNMPTPALPLPAQTRQDKYSGGISVAEWRRSHQTTQTQTTRRLSFHSPRFAYAAAASVLLLGGTWQVWNWVKTDGSSGTTVFETRAAQHTEAVLPDGSKLFLGARSLVWIDFKTGERQVVLDRGEAFFEVARDKRRPFTVRAGDTSITAIGTAFNVRRSGERITVAVAEGAVKVGPLTNEQQTTKSTDAHSSTSRQVRVSAGHRLVVKSTDDAGDLSRTNPNAVTAWRSGQLQYLGEPLKYVVADINRYSKQPLLIADSGIGELLVSGTVFENDIDGWLKSLQEILPVTVQSSNNQILLSSRTK